MTAAHMIDPARMLGQALSDASPDLMRHLLGTVINSLLSADVDAVCGAEYGQVSPDRVNSRNGYRHRDLDTRVGTIDVARNGTVFDTLHPEKRIYAASGQAMTEAAIDAGVLGDRYVSLGEPVTQDSINALMIRAARRGQRVVRPCQVPAPHGPPTSRSPSPPP